MKLPMLRRTALLGTALSVLLTLLTGSPAGSTGVTPVHTLAASQVWEDGVPQLVVDSRGWTTAVWTDDVGDQLRVMSATKRPGQPWSPATQLSPADSFSVYPSVAVAPDGTLWVMWVRNVGLDGRVEVARRSPGGAWSDPVLVSAAGLDVNTGQIAVNGAGVAVAVWVHYAGDGNYQVVASRASSTGVWSTPATLTPATSNALAPRVAGSPAADGNFHAIWIAEDSASGHYRIQGRSMIRGQWKGPSWVSPPDGDGGFPSIRVRGDGTAFAVWRHEEDGQDPQIQMRNSTPGGTWGWMTPLSSGTGGSTDPVIEVHATGVVFAWTRLYENLGPRVQVRRLIIGGGLSSTADLGTVGSDPHGAQLASTMSGKAFVSWQEKVSGDHVTHAVQAMPDQAWSAPQRFPAAASGVYSKYTRLAVDPSGDAVLLWQRHSFDADPVASLQTATWDVTRPLAGTPTVPLRISTGTTKVTWTASDDWSVVTSRLATRRVPWNASAWSSWATLQTSTARSKTVALTPGRTTCFRVRPTDSEANAGVETAARCTTTPVDDRTARTSTGWKKVAAATAYKKTLRSTTKKGATLSLPGARVEHLALLVARVPGGGKVRVYLGNKLLKTVSVGGPWKARHVIGIKAFASVKVGTIRLVVASSGKPVRIDGIFVGK